MFDTLTFVLKCLLLLMFFDDITGQEKKDERGNDQEPVVIRWIKEGGDPLRNLWESEVAPHHPYYAKCGYNGCQNCGLFYKRHVCLGIEAGESMLRGIKLITRIDGKNISEVAITSNILVTVDVSREFRAEDAEIIYQLFDYKMEDHVTMSFSVKMLLHAQGDPDYVCNLGKYSLYVPDGFELFMRYMETAEKCNTKAVCGQDVDKIVINEQIQHGEKHAEIHEFPWMVHIEGDTMDEKCSGVIITCEFVLTLASCVYKNSHRLYHLNIKMGTSDLRTKGRLQRNRKVNEIYLPPSFNFSNSHDDNVALIKISAPVAFNQLIRPICIPELMERFETGRGLVTGWGRSESGIIYDYLTKSDQFIQDSKECKPGTTDKHVCAASKLPDPYLGQQGSPLQVKPDRHFIVVGLNLYNTFKGNVYLKITPHITWIKAILLENFCRAC